MAGQAVVTVKDRQWLVNVATLPWELAQGLGGIPELPVGTGMLFDTGWEQIIEVTTVPMLFNLDIAFLSEELVVTEVYRGVEPGYVVTSAKPARYFLEVNGGELEGIDAGDPTSAEIMPLEEVPVVGTDWVSTLLGFLGLMVVGVFAIRLVQGLFEEPETRPALLPQTGKKERFKPGEIAGYKGERVRVQEHIGDRVSIWIPSRQEEVWVKEGKLEKIEPSPTVDVEKKVLLSDLITNELTDAGLGYVAGEIAHAVDKRARDSAWLEIWDGTTFDRIGGYPAHIGLNIPRLITAEVGIRTALPYHDCVAIAERIEQRIKKLDEITLDDGTIFKKSFVPVRRLPAVASKKRSEDLAASILKGLKSRDSYWAYVRYPRDKSAFVTIGAIIGGHYSWNPTGFTIWVDAWEKNPEWPEDHILGIRELRRPRTFEATEEGVSKALEYVETEFPTFTESRWVKKSIPIYVAEELGILRTAAPEHLPGVVVMPKIPDEARKDVLFVAYIRDLVRLGQKVTDGEVEIMWEAWKRRELSRLPHNQLIRRYGKTQWPAVIPTEKRPYRGDRLEFLPDSPEVLAQTIDAIGYRDRIDNAFQEAIRRAKGLSDIYRGLKEFD